VTHLLIDAMNVIGCRPDGWWRDRRGALERLVRQVERWSSGSGDPVTVVLEQPPFSPLPANTVEISWAPEAGPNAADDEIVRRLRDADDPARVRVVTSDRGLADRVRLLGGTVEPSRSFRRRLDSGR
jgi:hypothetical protein